MNREARVALLRVASGPECPEGNVRELMRESNPNCGVARERERTKRERENFPVKNSSLMHAGSTHRTKDCANTRGKLLGCRQTNPPREAGRQQPEQERGKLSPRDGILYQTVSRLPVANQVFLGSWMVDTCQKGRSQRSAPQRRHTAHLRRHSHCGTQLRHPLQLGWGR